MMERAGRSTCLSLQHSLFVLSPVYVLRPDPKKPPLPAVLEGPLCLPILRLAVPARSLMIAFAVVKSKRTGGALVRSKCSLSRKCRVWGGKMWRGTATQLKSTLVDFSLEEG